MAGPVRKLATRDEAAAAQRTIRDWAADRTGAHPCPCCGKLGVALTDRSARPYMEWYHFACAACGLDDTLAIPLPAHPPRLG